MAPDVTLSAFVGMIEGRCFENCACYLAERMEAKEEV